jgi:hypothetical protein
MQIGFCHEKKQSHSVCASCPGEVQSQTVELMPHTKKNTLLVQKGKGHALSCFHHFPPFSSCPTPDLNDAKHLSSESDGCPCHSHAAAEEPLSNHGHVGQALGSGGIR